MNGDQKEEAPRLRPLSGGIWTLFSWLRRSERSSSSDSLSSVGSARTAASFDFLAPGNCHFTNSALLLTAPVNPPSETYKKRLQERNLRRQRDGDLTLHRKYGLFREQGNEYDGFSLPPSRRASGNRERRATSECLQRRAAYVPGKRRAPLPPALTISASLPRTYKRKRPAPKPPVKHATKHNTDHASNNSTRMNSTSESSGKLAPDDEYEPLFSSKSKKCEKETTNTKDIKSRADKSFLKHIFENRKRNSVIETTIRLLPSISELDKQAAEIIETNKLRCGNNFNHDVDGTRDASYEVNAWFCTSCLRKYNSSISTCSYCLPEDKHPSKKIEMEFIKDLSSRHFNYPHSNNTNNNVKTVSSSQRSIDERKMLKEILKEMKDSLPKKHKDINKRNNFITETPTLRIGATVPETLKDTSQPSTSKENRNDIEKQLQASSRILPISPLLSETYTNADRKTFYVAGTKSDDLLNKNKIQHKVTSAFEIPENKIHDGSLSSPKISLPSTQNELFLSKKDKSLQENKSAEIYKDSKAKCTLLVSNNTKTDSQTTQETNFNNCIENKNNGELHCADRNNWKIRSNIQSELSSYSSAKNCNKQIKNDSQILQPSTNMINCGENVSNDNINQKTTRYGQKQPSLYVAKINVINESEKILPKCKQMPVNFSNSNAVVINSVTVITSHLHNKSLETSEVLPTKSPEYLSAQSSSKTSYEGQVTNNTQIKTLLSSSTQPAQNVNTVNSHSYVETESSPIQSAETSLINTKPAPVVQTPLKMSSLLNSLYSPRPQIGTKNDNVNANKQLQKETAINSNDIEITNINKRDVMQNEQVNDTITCRTNDMNSKIKTTQVGNTPMTPLQKNEVVVSETTTNVMPKGNSTKPESLPSTSGWSCNNVTVNTNYNNENVLGHYDRRRHFINQLEQSIARGDEVAAAEAAVKLAKLRVSCSVLSFSSQIMEQSPNANQNEKVYKQRIEGKSTKSQTVKTSQQNSPIPEAQLIPQAEHLGTQKTQVPENHNMKLPETKKVRETDENKINNESNVMPYLQSSEPSSSTQGFMDNIVPINIWIEDKLEARGPIKLRISRLATMADLRRQAEFSLGLSSRLQRWIVGQTLCTDEAATVASLAGNDFRAPFYLCLVQSEKNENPLNKNHNDEKDSEAKQNGEFYTELMKLEKQSLIPNIEPFECGVCMEECAPGAGVVLRDCIHTFCRECLSDVVQHCQEPAVPCPAIGCSGFLQEREIRTIVSAEHYERWLARSLATAESGTRNTFHCRTRDCTGWAFCDPGVRRFPCPVCKHINCVQCQAIHEGDQCEQYQAKLRAAVTVAETYKDDEGTQALLNSLISRGEALECPECKAIITKKWGCDWVKCSACKTEICWATKGPRWGPGGRGDTSGGCRCGVDGQRCHPSCGYCH